MQRTHCPICKKEVFYLVHHLHNMTDKFAIEQVKYDFSGWTEYEGAVCPALRDTENTT